MSVKYYLANDAIQKWGINISIRRTILNYCAEKAIDAEVIEPTPVPEQSNQPKQEPQ